MGCSAGRGHQHDPKNDVKVFRVVLIGDPEVGKVLLFFLFSFFSFFSFIFFFSPFSFLSFFSYFSSLSSFFFYSLQNKTRVGSFRDMLKINFLISIFIQLELILRISILILVILHISCKLYGTFSFFC